MADAKASASASGIGFCGLLTIVFIVLKLTKVIAWSWLWVLSPLWIPVALIVLGFVILEIVAAIARRMRTRNGKH